MRHQSSYSASRFISSSSSSSSSRVLALTFLAVFLAPTTIRMADARSWRDVELVHPSYANFHTNPQHLEIDPFIWYASEAATAPAGAPSTATSDGTSPEGTPSNNNDSNNDPPSRIPFDPDIPTATDSNGGGDIMDVPVAGSPAMYLPDSERFNESPVPLNPPPGYFNYEVQDSSLYGPGYPAMIRGDDGLAIRYQNNAWKFVQTPTNFYYREFSNNGFGTWNGALGAHNFDDNQCGNVGMQSPIDIRLSGVACVEHHQIRTMPGDFRVSGSAVDKRIEANKLRLVWQRRPCADLFDSRCEEPDPPFADFPNGWGGFADMMHVDFKLPSEHRIYGQAFDAEMQIFHLHPGRQRLPAISVLMRVQSGRHNAYLQEAIDAFQYEYDLHRAECGSKMRSNRQLVSDFHKNIWGDEAAEKLKAEDYDSWAEYSTLLDDPEFLERGKEHDRRLSSGIWYPHHPDLMPTIYFYGYDGSLTEPPCSEIVSWFVMDTPMTISPEQLDQLKLILFTHVDSNCRSTSTHFNGSVARPIQESGGRQVWQCTRDNYISDAERNAQQ